MRNLRQNSGGLTWENRGREKSGRGERRLPQSQRILLSCFVHPPPALSSAEVTAGSLPRNEPTLDHRFSLSITNLPKHKSTRSPRSYRTRCPVELDGFHTATDCWQSVWGWICVADSLWSFLDCVRSFHHLVILNICFCSLVGFRVQLWVWVKHCIFLLFGIILVDPD